MACLATGWHIVSSELLHALLELALMRIVVATGTGQALPVINNGRLGLELG
jgi:hypothetical protein